MKRTIRCAVAAAAMLSAAVAWAHEGRHETASRDAKVLAAGDVKLRDTELVDQDGRKARFKSETVGDRIVVMNFVYTSCSTICPVTSAVFADLREHLAETLGDSLGRDVVLLSVSIDPATDSPAVLKDYADKFGGGKGWSWLTGDKPNVDSVLKGLGAYSSDFTRHPSVVLVGDGRRGEWTRLYGVPDSRQLQARVEALLAARHDVAAGG